MIDLKSCAKTVEGFKDQETRKFTLNVLDRLKDVEAQKALLSIHCMCGMDIEVPRGLEAASKVINEHVKVKHRTQQLLAEELLVTQVLKVIPNWGMEP